MDGGKKEQSPSGMYQRSSVRAGVEDSQARAPERPIQSLRTASGGLVSFSLPHVPPPFIFLPPGFYLLTTVRSTSLYRVTKKKKCSRVKILQLPSTEIHRYLLK